jgi:hypothetical protein
MASIGRVVTHLQHRSRAFSRITLHFMHHTPFTHHTPLQRASSHFTRLFTHHAPHASRCAAIALALYQQQLQATRLGQTIDAGADALTLQNLRFTRHTSHVTRHTSNVISVPSPRCRRVGRSAASASAHKSLSPVTRGALSSSSHLTLPHVPSQVLHGFGVRGASPAN